jgi:hypothetical protein
MKSEDRRKRYQERHFKMGLCIRCPNQAEPGKKYCSDCLEIKRHEFDYKAHRLWREANKKCKRCGTPLDEDADGPWRYCINCRERTHETVIF